MNDTDRKQVETIKGRWGYTEDVQFLLGLVERQETEIAELAEIAKARRLSLTKGSGFK